MIEGKFLTTLRRRTGLSTAQLAKRLGLDGASAAKRLREMEKGNRDIPLFVHLLAHNINDGVFDKQQALVWPEHLFADSLADQEFTEWVVRLHWPRFVGVITEPDNAPLERRVAAVELESITVCSILKFLDDPTGFDMEPIYSKLIDDWHEHLLEIGNQDSL